MYRVAYELNTGSKSCSAKPNAVQYTVKQPSNIFLTNSQIELLSLRPSMLEAPSVVTAMKTWRSKEDFFDCVCWYLLMPTWFLIPYHRQWCFLHYDLISICILRSFSVICHHCQLTCSLIWMIWSKFSLAAYRIRGKTCVTLYLVLIGCKICMSNNVHEEHTTGNCILQFHQGNHRHLTNLLNSLRRSWVFRTSSPVLNNVLYNALVNLTNIGGLPDRAALKILPWCQHPHQAQLTQEILSFFSPKGQSSLIWFYGQTPLKFHILLQTLSTENLLNMRDNTYQHEAWDTHSIKAYPCNKEFSDVTLIEKTPMPDWTRLLQWM